MKRFIYSAACVVSLSVLSIPTSSERTHCSDPAYMSEPWVRTGGPIGGLGYDIRYNFADPTTWYVTDDWAGFHMSTDSGINWKQSNQGITSRKVLDAIPVFSATVDPHNPNIVWVGTNGPGDIFKSTDGGRSWVLMRNGVDPELFPLAFRGFTVDPRTSDIVYAMGEIASPAWTPDGSQRKGLQFDMTQGVVYKTIDGGQDWSEIWRGDNLARYCWVNPQEPDTIYISTGIFDREAANTDVASGFAGGVGILRSRDGGATWSVLDQANGLLDLFVGSLYMNPADPELLLAAASHDEWSAYGGAFTGGVYLSENGGEGWIRTLKAEGELITVVEYCVSDPEIAYAAGNKAVYRSEDAGHSWQRFSQANETWGPDGIVAGIPIDMQCDPTNPMRVFVNNYLGGNFLSTNGGESWILASDGYTGALVDHVAVAQDDPATVYAGSRSGVYRSTSSGQKWLGLVYPPEGMVAKFNEITAMAIDPGNSSHLLTVPKDFGTILYSYNGGQRWQIGDFLGNVDALVFAASDPSIVYAGTDLGIYVSHDGGVTFSAVESTQVAITAIVVHPLEPQTVYIATASAQLLKTTDGGQSTSAIGAGLPSLPVRTLAIDPSNPAVLFAGSGGKLGSWGGLYRSTDGGMNWVQSSAGMEPNARISSVVVDPTNGQIIYVADFLSGVYVSTDGGETWRAINDGLDRRTVNVLALSNSGTVLYAGIEGAGVYRLGGQGAQLYFAQFGNGQGFTSEILLTHPSPTGTASGKVDFFDDNGQPLKVGVRTMENEHIFLSVEGLPMQVTSSVDFSVPPLGAIAISTDGQGNLVAGAAVVTSTLPLGGVIRFSIPGIGIAGVGASEPQSSFIVPVRRKSGGINTGVAVHNPESQSVRLDLVLRNQAGEEIANATIEDLQAHGHLAHFIDQIFPDASTDDLRGTLAVQVTGGKVAAVAMELGTDPGQFTTLPVTPLN